MFQREASGPPGASFSPCAITVRSLHINRGWPRVLIILTYGLAVSLTRYRFLKSLIVWISLFCFRGKDRARIHALLSLRHGVSPGAKELGEVMW